jgi:hypothetical protein
MRKAVVLVAALVIAPVAMRAQGADPTKAVAGGGVLVEGWTARVDRANQKVSDVKFEKMGSGFHITGGPHAIFYSPANTAAGNYTVKATFSKTAETPHDESYGLFIAGQKLDQAEQNYMYCVVFGSGKFSVIHRFGNETHQMASKTADPVVTTMPGGKGAKDEIAMSVTSDKISCAINGKEVWSMAKSDAIGPGKLITTDGVYGLRASHNLSIHISNLGMTK